MELHTNIRHLFFWCLGVCNGWVGHMETSPYAYPLKTPLMQMAKDLQIHKMMVVGPMQGKSRVGASVCVCVFFPHFYVVATVGSLPRPIST
jgi:hypothetical protein